MDCNIEDLGYLRFSAIKKIFPVCKSSWYDGIKIKKYPRPVKINKGTNGWRKSDIIKLLKDPENSYFP